MTPRAVMMTLTGKTECPKKTQDRQVRPRGGGSVQSLPVFSKVMRFMRVKEIFRRLFRKRAKVYRCAYCPHESDRCRKIVTDEFTECLTR